MVLDLGLDLKVKYGTFDCFHNSLIFLMLKKKRNIDKFVKYNWNIEFIARHRIFTGGVHPESLLDFADEKLGYRLKKNPIENITELNHRWMIIPMDIFDLPYLKDFYHQIHQIHFVAAETKGKTVKIYDYFFDATVDMPVNDIIKSWSFFKEHSYLLEESTRAVGASKGEILPYLANQEFEDKYREIFKDFLQVVNDILYRPEPRLLNKCYGSVVSIIQNRKIHFNYFPYKYEDNIINYWTLTNRELIRFAKNFTTSDSLLKDSLNNALEAEMEYLSHIKQSCHS